ncbi:MAG: tetratricopeptide repeat protein [Deltaproteobacteria bacterium]|nr:tetratricopeptide repeat protein [Deltaproteobacteria bacterium]
MLGAAFFLTVLAQASCVTIGKFEKLQERVMLLEKENEALKEKQGDERQRMENLAKVMQEATEVLRKSGANMGADIDALKAESNKTRGTFEEVNFRLQRIEGDLDAIRKFLDDRMGFTLVQIPKELPADKKEMIAAGLEKKKKGDFLTARGIFRQFLEKNPDDAQAPEVQYYIAETFFEEKKYQNAIKEYQKVHDNYKQTKSSYVEKALLKIADSLLKSGDCQKAKDVLKYLIEYDKKSYEASKAKDMLNSLKKECK